MAILVGGGGSRYGLQNLAIQLFALVVLVWRAPDILENWRSRSVALKSLLVLTIALPLVQLVPLPPAMWQALPSGDIALASRSLVGAGENWFPLTLDFPRTVLAALSLVPPLVILGLVSAGIGTAQALLRAVVLVGVLNLLVGGLQVLTGTNHFLPYPVLVEGRLYGLFASHNTSGLMMVTALCALTGIRVENGNPTTFRLVRAAIAILLLIGILLTQSRSSVTLALVPVGVFLLRWFLANRSRLSRKSLLAMGAGIVALAVTVPLVLTSSRFAQTLARFESLEDQRPNIWSDTLEAIRAFFPFGSGIGSFDEVYQYFESLETLVPRFARRAHNDYLELALEAGIFGLVLLLGWIAWGLFTWWKSRSAEEGREVDAAALAMACIAAQSVVDYPLRNQAVLCLAAIFVAVLAARASRLRGRIVV